MIPGGRLPETVYAEILLANVERLLADRSSPGASLDEEGRACAAIAWHRALLSHIGNARINRIVARLSNSPASDAILRVVVGHFRTPLISENAARGRPLRRGIPYYAAFPSLKRQGRARGHLS